MTNELGNITEVTDYPIIKSLKGIITKKQRMCIKTVSTGAEIVIDADAFPVLDENLNVVAGVTSFVDVTINILLEKTFKDLEETCQHLGRLIEKSILK